MTSPISLVAGLCYHIYNRGTNRENIFLEKRNYAYFLQLYIKHIEPVAETYAYCLLRNHFHVFARIRDDGDSSNNRDPKGLARPLGSPPSSPPSSLIRANTWKWFRNRQ
jgi:putative transposase